MRIPTAIRTTGLCALVLALGLTLASATPSYAVSDSGPYTVFADQSGRCLDVFNWDTSDSALSFSGSARGR